ncbi:DUF6920 family protein [Maribacter sp. ACAM166]|uniref:DUF6920 family protein n=1 Tax=Maribacter sp. ACAM166 TaxID=2508996 RepID=UPI003977A67E
MKGRPIHSLLRRANIKNVNGYNLPTYGKAVWHYPDGEFVYWKFNLKSVYYNISF